VVPTEASYAGNAVSETASCWPLYGYQQQLQQSREVLRLSLFCLLTARASSSYEVKPISNSLEEGCIAYVRYHLVSCPASCL
jgi:hypothetical protein